MSEKKVLIEDIVDTISEWDCLWNTDFVQILDIIIQSKNRNTDISFEWFVVDYSNGSSVRFNDIYSEWFFWKFISEKNKWENLIFVQILYKLFSWELNNYVEPLYWQSFIIIEYESWYITFLITEEWLTCIYKADF
jgi:hypothetical protein